MGKTKQHCNISGHCWHLVMLPVNRGVFYSSRVGISLANCTVDQRSREDARRKDGSSDEMSLHLLPGSAAGSMGYFFLHASVSA